MADSDVDTGTQHGYQPKVPLVRIHEYDRSNVEHVNANYRLDRQDKRKTVCNVVGMATQEHVTKTTQHGEGAKPKNKNMLQCHQNQLYRAKPEWTVKMVSQ